MDPLLTHIAFLREDLKTHRTELQLQLDRIELKLSEMEQTKAQFKGGWLVISFLGSGIISLVVAVASAMMK